MLQLSNCRVSLFWPCLLIVTAVARATAVVTLTPCQVRDIQAGGYATCMVLDVEALVGTVANRATVPAGGAACFGLGPVLGANVSNDSPAPLPVVGLSSVATMKPFDRSHSCAVFAAGVSGWRQLRCTGSNNDGRLGCGFTGGNRDYYGTPFQVTPCDAVGLPTPSNATQVQGVTGGYFYSVAWLADGRVFAAGLSPYNGQENDTNSFVEVAGLSNVVACSGGGYHVCCLKADNTVWCWGANFLRQLGVDPFVNGRSTVPLLIAGLGAVVGVAAGEAHTNALLSNGTVMSWGSNGRGSLGDNTTSDSSIPRLAVNLTNVAQISAGGNTACARLTNGEVRCWGENDNGQVGASCNTCTSPQSPVPNVSGVGSVSMGHLHVCVMLQNKTATCWGAGGSGQLTEDYINALPAPGRPVMCGMLDPDACATSPCTASGNAVTCTDKIGSDTSPSGRTCTCKNSNYIYSNAHGCIHGCPAPPPTDGTTSFQSCSTAPSAGSYSVGTVCTATCNGGWAKCGLLAPGAPAWQVTACSIDCSSAHLPTVPNAVWSCAASVATGGSCSGSCAAGFEGRLTAVCAGPSWDTTGTCERVACIGPPSSGAPNATFECASTAVGQPCAAICATGLSGNPRRVCLADGNWGALEGDACVDCAANQPTLTTNQPSTFVEAGTTTVSANFTFTGPLVKGVTALQATLEGLTVCATQPAELIGAISTPTVITVSCQLSTGISPGLHMITLRATTTGSKAGCGSGSTTSFADILATSAPAPAPSVQLATAGAAAPACKAAAGRPSTASATFTYTVAPTTAGPGGLVLEMLAVSAAGAVCTVARSGGLERGSLQVICLGVFDSLTSLDISVILKASTPGSLEGSATSSQTVAFICCTPATTLAHAVNTNPDSECRTCGGSASSVEGVWLNGSVQVGVMRTGAISAPTCSSATSIDVSSVTVVCDEQNSKLLMVTITNPAGSATLRVEFLTRCNFDTVTPNMPSCLAQGPYRWRTVTPNLNSLTETTGPSGEQILTFGILQTSNQATCTCGTSFYAIKQTGAFSTGRAVSSSGSCSTGAAGADVKAKTAKKKAKGMAGLSGRRPRLA